MKQKHFSKIGSTMKTRLAKSFVRHSTRYAQILHIFHKYELYRVFTRLRKLHERGKNGAPKLSEAVLREHCLYAENMTRAFEELGTCFIKLGQLLSTRPDLLPSPYICALSRLQNDIAPAPGNQIMTIIEQELGASLSEHFSFFDPVPFAAASIAQVHKAQLHNGTLVAIKVQRPGVRDQIEIDTEVLLEVTHFITRHTQLGNHYGLVAMVQEIRQSLIQELDFLQEATNTQSISHEIREFRHLLTPTIYRDLSSRQVLTLGFIPGRHLAQLDNEELGSSASTTIARELLLAYLKQIVIKGTFHCDPHPGNLLLTDDGRLALLDFGMIGRLNTRQIEKLLLLLLAFSEQQGKRVADIYLELVQVPKRFDRRAFEQKICELVRQYHESSEQGAEVGRTLLKLVTIASTFRIAIPENFTLLGKALLNLDGTLHLLAPGLNLTQVVHHYLPSILQQRLFAQISPGRSIAWLLNTKHGLENILQQSDALFEKLRTEQSTTSAQIEHLEKTLCRTSRQLSLGIIASSFILGLAFFFSTKHSRQR